MVLVEGHCISGKGASPDQGEHLMKANIKESKDNQAENASLISTGALCSKEIATEAAQSGTSLIHVLTPSAVKE